jgi:4-amino-4-deoxy-L-arabinose transferase-like glycosyltransferase
MISWSRSLLIVLLVWAAIYLPALGSLAIKGEEGRRILPAIRMIETGDYIVPRVGSTTYFRKPPLVNWLVAVSFKVFGVRNEWTARLPSALSVLVVGIAFVTVARGSLSPRGSTIAALIWLTNIGMIEKGRLIEIEGLYVSLSGLAIIFWLSFWSQKKSPWLTWLPASIFLGLALLAKGPLHLVFFYGIVFAVLWQTKNWRLLFHPAHFVGLAIMLAIFAAWAVPFLRSTTMQLAVHKWSAQFSGRLSATDFNFLSWIQNLPRSFVYFLPWVILFPFVRFTKFRDEGQRPLARALTWGIFGPLLIVNLVPGALPRYSMPALVPASWLLAMSYAGNALNWPHKLRPGGAGVWAKVVAGFVGLGLVIGGIGYPVTALVLRNRQQVKKAAAQINALLPVGETLYVVDPDYQPVLFYMKVPLNYATEITKLPANTHYFLVRTENEQEAITTEKWAPRCVRQLARIKDLHKREMVLFEVSPPPKGR